MPARSKGPKLYARQAARSARECERRWAWFWSELYGAWPMLERAGTVTENFGRDTAERFAVIAGTADAQDWTTFNGIPMLDCTASGAGYFDAGGTSWMDGLEFFTATALMKRGASSATIAVGRADSDSRPQNGVIYQLGGQVYFSISTSASNVWRNGAYDNTNVNVLTYRYNGRNSTDATRLIGYANGAVITTTGSGTVPSTLASVPSRNYHLGTRSGDNPANNGYIGPTYLHRRTLRLREIRQLALDDPLGPFRPKRYYALKAPAAGGGTVEGAAADGVDFSDSAIADMVLQATAADGITLSDTAAAVATLQAAAADGVTLSDGSSVVTAVDAVAADGIILTDAGVGLAELQATASDGVALSDFASALATLFAAAAEGVDFSDSALGVIPANTVEGAAADGATFADSAVATVIREATAADAITLSDASTVEAILQALAADGATFADVTSTIEAAIGALKARSARYRLHAAPARFQSKAMEARV